MSTVNDICKYLNISDDNMSINEFYISTPPNSEDLDYLGDYDTDSYSASSDYESNFNYKSKNLRIRPLNSINRTDVSLILNFVSKIVNLMYRLTCNLRSNDEEINIYINDTKELIEVLKYPPAKYNLMKDKACSEILINAQAMKNNISENFKLT